jgi:hypothetical protein
VPIPGGVTGVPAISDGQVFVATTTGHIVRVVP